MRYEDILLFCNMQLVHNKGKYIANSNFIYLNKLVDDFIFHNNISEDNRDNVCEYVNQWFDHYPYRNKYQIAAEIV